MNHNGLDNTHPFSAEPRFQSAREQELPLGAHLTTSRRGYTHHGVYVGDGRVVHYSGFSAFWQCGPVEEVSLPRFSDGHTVQSSIIPNLYFRPKKSYDAPVRASVRTIIAY